MLYALLTRPGTTKGGCAAMASDQDLTLLLDYAGRGEPNAKERLFAAVHEELRQLARAQMARERDGHTIQPTMLVNDVFMRLGASGEQSWENRRHFFGAAAEAMRRILIDHARARGAAKRRAPGVREPLENVAARSAAGDLDVEALDAALTTLEQEYPRQAEVVKLRFYAGLAEPDIAQALSVSLRTVQYDWKFARAWLLERMAAPTGDASETPTV